MTRLILEPSPTQLRYTLLHGQPARLGRRGKVGQNASGLGTAEEAWSHLLKAIPSNEDDIDAIGMIILHGGAQFRAPILLDTTVMKSLRRSIVQSPLHGPQVVALCEYLQENVPHIPIHLFFQTAFFHNLPARERVYAIPRDTESITGMEAERSGYQGLYHDFACRWAASYLKQSNRRCASPRMLSFCLDRHLDMVAVRGRKPLMITSGTTPLQGLPGATTCGEIDPGVILQMAREIPAGPEELNHILTRESGFLGMTGKPSSLPDILQGDSTEDQEARDVFLHRSLLAAGAGIAAMGGLDALVFSGVHHAQGHAIGNWLLDHISFLKAQNIYPRLLLFQERIEFCVVREMDIMNQTRRLKAYTPSTFALP